MSDDTQETITVDEAVLGIDQVIAIVETRFPRGPENWARAADMLVAEVRRLREESEERLRRGVDLALRFVNLEADRDQLSASNLRLVAERDRLAVEVERLKTKLDELQFIYDGLCK